MYVSFIFYFLFLVLKNYSCFEFTLFFLLLYSSGRRKEGKTNLTLLHQGKKEKNNKKRNKGKQASKQAGKQYDIFYIFVHSSV